MGKAIKRVIGLLMVVLSAASIIVTVFLVIRLWQARLPLTQSLDSGMTLLSDTLATTSDGLSVADEALTSAETSIANLQSTVDTMAKSISDTQPMISSMRVLLGSDLPDTIKSVQTSLESAQSGAKVIDTVLKALTFFNPSAYNPPQSLDLALGKTADGLKDLPASFVSMETSLQTAGGNLETIETQVSQIATDIGAISTSVTSAQQVLTQYKKLVADLQASLDGLKPNLSTWINYLFWGVTFVLVWLAIAQAGILLEGWEYLSGQD